MSMNEASPFQIVPANWRDLNELRALEGAVFEKDAWPLLELIGVLTLPGQVRLKVVTVDGRMIAFAAGEPHLGSDVAWIDTIGVHPDWRRRGVASLLLNACEQCLHRKRVRLAVRASNDGARALYALHGYRPVDVERGYYEDGEDGVIMEKVLGEE
jgi:ribosomal-protein-alanine N-acetyltransferase